MRLPETGPGDTIVGVAVTVPEPYCGRLHDARVRCGDPQARHVVPHVTIIGPTVVPEARIGEVDAQLARTAARHAPFRIRLHGSQTFRPVSPVVFVALEEGAAQCAALESALRTGLLGTEARFPYHPHVTVAHALDDATLDEAQAAMAGFDASFEVSHLHRFVYDAGAWRPARQFALGAADAGVSART